MNRDIFLVAQEIADERDALRRRVQRLEWALDVTRAQLESADGVIEALVADESARFHRTAVAA